MVQPLRESRDRYEELKQIDDAMNEVGACSRVDAVSWSSTRPLSDDELRSLQVQKKKSENLTMGGKKK